LGSESIDFRTYQQFKNGEISLDTSIAIRLIEKFEHKKDNNAVSSTPALTNDWLNLYSSPTVSGAGRHVAKHPDAATWDWGMQEELSAAVPNSGALTKNSRDAITADGGTPIAHLTNNNLYTDATGRYWVALGPNIMNPNYDGSSRITTDDMQYGTMVDIVVRDGTTNLTYYIPAVVGDAKEHSSPDGLYQTGVPFDSSRPTVAPGTDRNTVEFMGYNITQVNGRSSVNITNNYELVEIIVYDGVYNYK
jgi:hypothetical protein